MMDARRGFSLVELLVVMVLGGIVLAAGVQTLIIQQRGYRQHRAVVAAQQINRLSLSVLMSELRELSAVGGDLMEAERDLITFRAYRKLGFACAVSGSVLDVWELGSAFAVGDSVVVFAGGQAGTASDDQWFALEIGAVGATTCTDDWGSSPEVAITLSGTPSGVGVGAPIRSFVPMTYGLYQIDGEWMLGRHEPGETPDPLLGPLLAPEEDGLVITYYDENGNELLPVDLTTAANREAVTRIAITVRGQSPAPGARAGEFYTDSLTTELFLRNY